MKNTYKINHNILGSNKIRWIGDEEEGMPPPPQHTMHEPTVNESDIEELNKIIKSDVEYNPLSWIATCGRSFCFAYDLWKIKDAKPTTQEEANSLNLTRERGILAMGFILSVVFIMYIILKPF